MSNSSFHFSILTSCKIPHPYVQQCDANELIALGTKYTLSRLLDLDCDCDQEPELKVSDLANALKVDGPSQYNNSPVSAVIHTPILAPYEIAEKVFKKSWGTLSAETAKGIGYFSAATVIAYKFCTKTLGDHSYPYNIITPDRRGRDDYYGCIIRAAVLNHQPIIDAFSLPDIINNCRLSQPFIEYFQDDGFRMLRLDAENIDKLGFKYVITSEKVRAFVDNASSVKHSDISAYDQVTLCDFFCVSTFVHYICLWEQHIDHMTALVALSQSQTGSNFDLNTQPKLRTPPLVYRRRRLLGNKTSTVSLADKIKGKQGRFRQNLLGKRVDYSARSVIICGPNLRLHQCGLPKKMALELFKPFIFGRLEMRGHANTIEAAKNMVEREKPVVWDVLEEVICEHPVLLNRAPTLHRLGIQAFEPVLIEDKAIRLHPLVCSAFNADFDGDEVAVYIPLTLEAQLEARALMMSTNNILSPASGDPIIVPAQDVVLGLYYMTKSRVGARGEGMVLADAYEAERVYKSGIADMQARVACRIAFTEKNPETGEFIEKNELRLTTIGRAILSLILPRGMSYDHIDPPVEGVTQDNIREILHEKNWFTKVSNQPLDKKRIADLLNTCYRLLGLKDTVMFADRVMYTGFRNAAISGSSVCVDDMLTPKEKPAIIAAAQKEVLSIQQQ